MVIISKKARQYSKSQIYYAGIYILITLVALVFLNFYCAEACQRLFYQNKEASMLELTQLASEEMANLDVLTPTGAENVITQLERLHYTRLLVTDRSGVVVYDTEEIAEGQYAMLPHIIKALDGHNVFTWKYHNGDMRSEAATPIVSYGVTVGCIYMMDFDPQQGAVIKSLQLTILTITVILGVVLLVYSIVFSNIHSKRLQKIMNSMRVIQGGNYDSKVDIIGNDELAFFAKEFNSLVDRLRISENKRSQFVSDASHELKTPLASVKLLSDSILQNDMDMDTIKEFVKDIGEEAERLNRTAQKLLDLTRGENSAVEDAAEIMYMEPSVRKVIQRLSPLAESLGITIDLQILEDTPVLIRQDDLYLILFNLAENGIKYNTPNGTLTITLSRKGNQAVLKISDTGVGIPEQALGKIFERFYRVDKARSRATGGSGLGLAIVRSTVERSRGSIAVESQPGKGSTFTVVFPASDSEVTHS